MEEIQNEIRAILKVCCEGGTHQNVVTVFRHGVLQPSGHVFIDMELCAFNLETYLQTLWKPSREEEFEMRETGIVKVDGHLRMRYIWVIMIQIASGIAFIHQQKEVHRDLKPRNGNFPLMESFD
jgi:serine/threonine protein kinase